MQYSARIKQVMQDKSLNIPSLSSEIGISKRTIESYVQDNRTPGPDFLAAMTTRLGVSASWILTGLGPKYNEQRTNVVPAATDFLPVPLYPVEASAGHGAVTGDEASTQCLAVRRSWAIDQGFTPDMLAIIAVRGDSMEPDLRHGDLILIDRSKADPRAMDEGNIYVVRFADDLFVKRIQHLPDNRLMLLSSNPIYRPVMVEPSDLGSVQIIGRVVYSTHRW